MQISFQSSILYPLGLTRKVTQDLHFQGDTYITIQGKQIPVVDDDARKPVIKPVTEDDDAVVSSNRKSVDPNDSVPQPSSRIVDTWD